jgi:hypothetical protein
MSGTLGNYVSENPSDLRNFMSADKCVAHNVLDQPDVDTVLDIAFPQYLPANRVLIDDGDTATEFGTQLTRHGALPRAGVPAQHDQPCATARNGIGCDDLYGTGSVGPDTDNHVGTAPGPEAPAVCISVNSS